MKKRLLKLMTGSFLMACTAAYAQPTLTATGCNPIVGESFTMKIGDYESEGSSGANQTWTLTFANASTEGTTNCVASSTTPKGSSFPNANIAMVNSIGGTMLYQKTSSGAQQNYGFVGGSATTVCPYSNPEDLLHFPLNYQNTYSDNWAGTFVSGGEQYFRFGISTITADGYGTLTTPTGTYTNVMRVHFVEEYYDSVDLSGLPLIISYLNDQYLWFKDGVHVAIANVYNFESDVSAPISGGSYLKSNTSGLSETEDIIKTSNLYPNPAIDKVNIDFTLTTNKKVDILIFNEIGQRMDFRKTLEGLNGVNNAALNVSGLPAGIYFVNIIVDGKIAERKKFVIGNQ